MSGGGTVGGRFGEFYAHPRFRAYLHERLLPDLLKLGPLGEDPLHLAAGPAAAARALRREAPRLTVAELDPAYTAEVTADLADDPDTEVVDARADDLPFASARFTAVTVVFSLLHLPDPATQDRALAEIARVLRPGGLLLGVSLLDGPELRGLDPDRHTVPIDPLTWGDRLAGAGLAVVRHDVWRYPRFAATPA